MRFQSEIKNSIVFTCSGGCGYVEQGRMWDSPPIGRDGELRCPDCGEMAWDFPRLTKAEADQVVQYGASSVERLLHI